MSIHIELFGYELHFELGRRDDDLVAAQVAVEQLWSGGAEHPMTPIGPLS